MYALRLPQVPHYSREYFTDHIDGVDTELNWLQDQLSAGSISIDPNALLGVSMPDLHSIQDLVSSYLGQFYYHFGFVSEGLASLHLHNP